MKILSIETSCDETAIALLDITGPREKPEVKILGNTLLSQVPIHEQYGGVYPMLAKREHEKNLPIILEQTLDQAAAALSLPRRGLGEVIDVIAVTAGPGLEPALWAGITFAEELGRKWNKPVVPVNHMQGHIWSVLYKTDQYPKSQIINPKSGLALPALALLVSGGHTELVLVKDFGEYEILGRTLDDAVGEAFDKVARMLGLSYPGGPKIGLLASKSREKKTEAGFKLPRPMINSGDLNFSYSGLKTAVLYKLRADNIQSEEDKEDMAREFEEAAIEVLISKTRRALEETGVKTLIVGGGVSASPYLRLELKKLADEFPGLNLLLPEKSLTTDNAVMIGLAAYVEISTDPSILNKPKIIAARGNLPISSQ